MAQKWGDWYRRFGLGSLLVVGGAIALGGGLSPIAAFGNCALAQITPDGTLGAESSVVTPTNIDGLSTEQIDGGATRGTNLFHSFEQLSVPTGSAAYFNNTLGIQNIISRVTGSSISNIDGLIRANASANLFLLNPNGIIFGPNASLNIGGSFLASTASSLNLADGTQFSATAHSTTPLLTVSVPLGLQFEGTAGRIQVQGNGQGLRGTSSDLIDTTFGLRVQPNQTLALVGGDVALEGGTLKTAGGRIELGSVAEPGLVSLNPTEKGFSLDYEGVSTFGDIRLFQQAAVDASGEGAGDVQVRGRRVTLTNGSQISANTLGAEPGGALNVTASEYVEAIGESADGEFSSGLLTRVYRGATGAGGNLTVETGRLIVRDGALIQASTFGAGSSGTLEVRASDSIELSGTSWDGKTGSGLFASASESTGAGGNLTIATGRLIVQGGAQIDAATFGEGSAGTLVVLAHESVEVIGESANGQFSSALRTTANLGATGAGGNLTLETGRLIVRDGAQIGVATLSSGAAGNLTLRVSESVELSGTSAFDSRIASGLFAGADSESTSTGDGGNLTLETGRLIVRDGAQITGGISGEGSAGTLEVRASDSVELSGTSLDGQTASGLYNSTEEETTGAGGNLTVETGRLIIRDGALISTSTSGEGSAGTLEVRASDSVELSGTSLNGQIPSGLFTQVDQGATGLGGNLTVETRQLIVRDGARVSASTLGEGSAGTLAVRASESVELSGTSVLNSRIASGLLTGVSREATGTGGNLTVETPRLIIRDGAQIFAATYGNGAAGTLAVNASQSVEVIGTSADGEVPSRLTTQTNGIGDAGELTIETGQLTVRDGAFVTVSSQGSGRAGDLQVLARNLLLDNQGAIRATTTSGNGGGITLQAQNLLLLRRNSNISTRAGTQETGGTGGNITISTDNLVALENSDIDANAFGGLGGQVRINASGIFGTEGRELQTPESDITATSDLGLQFSGTVEINTPDVDPSRGLVNLPAELVDVARLIVQGCPGGVGPAASKFVVTGRGGLPPTPRETIGSEQPLEDWGMSIQGEDNAKRAAILINPTSNAPPPLVEAQGWVINDLGEVVLTATALNVTPNIPWLTPANCHTP